MKNLETIPTKSDKISHHGYHRFYERFLSSFVGKNILMLELGYENGHSIELWEKYFENVRIHSIDISENPNDARVEKYFQVDQNSNDQLDHFVKNNQEKYEFIIDDASHVPMHQWETFIRFFEILKEGGIYIIEDVETSFWKQSEIFGYHFNSDEFSLFQKIPKILEAINQEFVEKPAENNTLEEKAIQQIESVFIGCNCIIFEKKSTKNQNYYRTKEQYRHKGFINFKKPVIAKKKGFFSKIFK